MAPAGGLARGHQNSDESAPELNVNFWARPACASALVAACVNGACCFNYHRALLILSCPGARGGVKRVHVLLRRLLGVQGRDEVDGDAVTAFSHAVAPRPAPRFSEKEADGEAESASMSSKDSTARMKRPPRLRCFASNRPLPRPRPPRLRCFVSKQIFREPSRPHPARFTRRPQLE
jgi:hypothetical protein